MAIIKEGNPIVSSNLERVWRPFMMTTDDNPVAGAKKIVFTDRFSAFHTSRGPLRRGKNERACCTPSLRRLTYECEKRWGYTEANLIC